MRKENNEFNQAQTCQSMAQNPLLEGLFISADLPAGSHVTSSKGLWQRWLELLAFMERCQTLLDNAFLTVHLVTKWVKTF